MIKTTPFFVSLKSKARFSALLALVSVPFLGGCQQQQPAKQRVTQDALIEANRNLVGRDAAAIKAYVEQNKLNFTETKTGMWYSIEDEGKGDKIKKGDVVRLAYTLTLLDGTLCYSSKKDGPKEFLVGQGGVESGLEEAVLMLRKSAKAKFIMPPHLAHGLVGDDNKIPARSTIIYDVEVLNVK
jgi:FKBP-type peptidyl-prolyl cis-trans isomerase FkpA